MVVWCGGLQIMKATNFAHFDYAAIKALRVLPLLESKDKNITWARGSIRDPDTFQELVVTGPRLPTLFSGCRFNNIVFSIAGPGQDDASYAFEAFLNKVLSHVEDVVSAAPDKFRPGCKNAALLHFDRDFIRPSSYSADMPNEMRVKVAVKRDTVDEHGEVVDSITTVFHDVEGKSIDPDSITAGSEIVPIIKIGYYRNGNKFGLNLTLLKGLVDLNHKRARSTDFSQLEFDL
jgi:hypothetical protein